MRWRATRPCPTSRSRPHPASTFGTASWSSRYAGGSIGSKSTSGSHNLWAPWPNAPSRDASQPAARQLEPITGALFSKLARREAIVADPAGADLGDLARTLGHTRFHVSRVFSQVTGMTLSHFRNRVRVAIALDRLADGHENFAALSADLGFVDQSHLSRVVRTFTGERLSELRQRLDPPDRLEPQV